MRDERIPRFGIIFPCAQQGVGEGAAGIDECSRSMRCGLVGIFVWHGLLRRGRGHSHNGSFSHLSFHRWAIASTSFFHTSTPLVVGSMWPYHHPTVGTSPASVLAGTEVGGDPSGCAR